MELIRSTLGALLGITFALLFIRIFSIILEKLGWFDFIGKHLN